jgi:hypothetical protein
MRVPRMKIPVFVSAPSVDNMSPTQEKSADVILKLLSKNHFEWRALGRGDYPMDTPLREVLQIIKHCSGGIILGFEQFRADTGEWKRGSNRASHIADPVSFPTPWNQLEAGILFSAGLPIMIFREPNVAGGVFDVGSTEVFVHQMPTSPMSKDSSTELDAVFSRWAARVSKNYYGD